MWYLLYYYIWYFIKLTAMIMYYQDLRMKSICHELRMLFVLYKAKINVAYTNAKYN